MSYIGEVVTYVQHALKDTNRMSFSLLINAAHTIPVLVGYVAYSFVESNPRFDCYKIQPSQHVNVLAAWLRRKLFSSEDIDASKKTCQKTGASVYWASVKDNLLNHLIVGPVMITIPLYNLFQWRSPILVNMSSPIDPKPSNWLKIITQLVFYVLVEDFMFYWTHRFLHWGPIYPYIHKQHHEYKSPVTISAEYAHPIEKLFGNHVPVFMGPLLWPCSPFLSAVWVVLRLSKTIEAHSGYLIPGSPFSSWETWQTTAERHDFHHSNNKGCFGSFLRFWDYIGGTEDDFLKYHRQESTT